MFSPHRQWFGTMGNHTWTEDQEIMPLVIITAQIIKSLLYFIACDLKLIFLFEFMLVLYNCSLLPRSQNLPTSTLIFTYIVSTVCYFLFYFGNWLALLFYFLSLSVSLLNPYLPALMLN